MATTQTATVKSTPDLETALKGVLNSIEREREREIVARRFGLYDRKETLEQIGELLGITRERVRQLEKVVVTRLKTSALNGSLATVAQIENAILSTLSKHNDIMRISKLAPLMSKQGNKLDQSRIYFMSELAPKISVIEESDYFYSSVGVKSIHDEKKIREITNRVVEVIKKIGHPATIIEIAKEAREPSPAHTAAIASISKHLAELNGQWGLTKWPMVNPKNIRDKIYVILHENGSHMHFNEIAAAIRQSDFKRKDVTTQAIHNELIKDKRFVLIGRGIYALQEWGYKKGTVADMISEVLNDAGEPLHRDEIVKRVLKLRHVKETTILLNLQGKDQFKRTAKATYALA
ncbi:MAG: sigma factor-like helix-turn-helix DNA-binding protein [Candidatus Saccharibacteria bacterium]